MIDWLLAFAFTQAIEMPIYRRWAKTTWAQGFGASALTHPFVWFVIPGLVDRAYLAWLAPTPSLRLGDFGRYALMVAVAETFAVVAEALYLAYLDRRRPLLWALVANATSASLGLLSRHLFGVP
jgi:hypothetical protein